MAGGSKPTGREGIAWVREVARRGAGEILLTSMDRDGTRAGYDLELLERVCAAVEVPVIASGGVGSLEHLAEGLRFADAALAASIFHDGQHTVGEAKRFLADARDRGAAVTVAVPIQAIRFDERGLVPVIAQELDGTVLMLAWANREALEATARTGRAHYWSRSRKELWRKGDTSGHVQEVVEVRTDCDGDAVLYRVRQTGPACHEGKRSCFDPAP